MNVFFFDRQHFPFGASHFRSNLPSQRLVQDDHVFADREFTGGLVEIFARCDALSADTEKLRFEKLARRCVLSAYRNLSHIRANVPKARLLKANALALALDNHSKRRALHPTGRQAVGNFFPDQRRERVTDQPIQHSARFLRAHQAHVDFASLLQGLLDRRFGDLMEHHALDWNLGLQQLGEVPGNRLPFAVFVGR